jgi:hypothetical protein
MKKSELQTGMMAILRNNTKAIILKDFDNRSLKYDLYVYSYRYDIKLWDYLKAYDNSLNQVINHDYDIMKVFKPKNINSILNLIDSIKCDENWELIWERIE